MEEEIFSFSTTRFDFWEICPVLHFEHEISVFSINWFDISHLNVANENVLRKIISPRSIRFHADKEYSYDIAKMITEWWIENLIATKNKLLFELFMEKIFEANPSRRKCTPGYCITWMTHEHPDTLFHSGKCGYVYHQEPFTGMYFIMFA